MRSLTPAILALSLLTFDVTARSRVSVPPSDLAARPAESHSIRALNEIAIAPVLQDPAIHQTNPVIASDGESFLLVWRESTGCCFFRTRKQDLGSLYATRLNLRGEPVGEPTLITTTATTARPGLAFDGTNYLLVWNQAGSAGPSVVGQRFSVNATPVDPSPFFLRFDNEVDAELAVACGENDCLAIFSSGRALISRDGAVLRSMAERGSLRNDLVATPTGYAATGTVVRSYPFSPSGQLVSFEAHAFTELPNSESSPLGPFQITTFDSPWWERVSSSLATNGSLTIVAAVNAENLKPRELFITQVPPGDPTLIWHQKKVDVGLVDGQAPIVQDPQMIWTGRRFLLVFLKTNEDLFGAVPLQPISEKKAEITGVWIDGEGSVEGPVFDITTSDALESLPAIAVNARGLIALTFVRGRGYEGTPVPRLFVKMLHDGAGATETTRSRPARRSAGGRTQSVTLTAEKSGIDRVLLRLTNDSREAIGYNLCGSSIDRKIGDEWTDVTSWANICPAVIYSLQPGASASLERLIIEDIEPGTYRFRTFVSPARCVLPPCLEIASNPLELP